MVRPGFEPETSRVHFKCETDVITNYTIEPLFEVETYFIYLQDTNSETSRYLRKY